MFTNRKDNHNRAVLFYLCPILETKFIVIVDLCTQVNVVCSCIFNVM